MVVTRTIHPVGQGGFYTETFKTGSVNHTVVYDCGGNRKKWMEEYLNKYLHRTYSENKKKIDAVFISHLHADHINGLEYLLDNADVKLLILPQLTEDMVFEALVYNECYSVAGDVTRLVLNLLRAGANGNYGETRVIQVYPVTPEDRIDTENERGGQNLADPCNVKKEIESGTCFYFNSMWMFIPFNPPFRGKKEGFASALKETLGVTSDITIRTLPDLIKGKIDLCKSLYEDYFGKNHNSYSMTLFSGTSDPKRFKMINPSWCCPFDYSCCLHNLRYISPNCLYTGDFEPHHYVGELIRFYRPMWETIHSIQVPHHGSRKNFDPRLYKNALMAFVSVGERNRHRHPNLDTLARIYGMNCFPIIVTESPVTEKKFRFRDWI